ncbi:hypothetical protein HRW18_18380 [Streptomyces lunaelactis]|uniref:hypothetical protein n=1 Tax=Streptomyces lunaelactis TaxID=1535768 RepID=UPI00158454AB|nr:hypothetical protein [Streptomyces lunaelactis]NUK09934.1 hypothetical protein [Streptomyces lunaelactis]NUK72756.1 hypothetical protein [Streptomyces lunaelactis]NUL11398.1 hypothetical protein [Streptomyces lunaelactis]NUL25989.1 hypothetical protein [Streptomyces lunaelactis]
MPTTAPQARTVLEWFPAGHPRGSWPADEYAATQRAQGTDARVVMDLASDQFLVVANATAQ